MLNTRVRAVRLNVLSHKYVKKKLWLEVGAVLPGKGVVADNKLAKGALIPEGLKERTVQIIREIDLSAGTIIESEARRVSSIDCSFSPVSKSPPSQLVGPESPGQAINYYSYRFCDSSHSKPVPAVLS